LSPRIFSVLKHYLQKELSYHFLECSPLQLPSFIQKSKESYRGFNVTIPFKEAIIPHLDELDPVAKEIGAVNVVAIHGGKLKGFNTDYLGVMETLKENGVALKGKEVVVFGAGGAAKGVVYALWKLGVKKIFVINRSDVRKRDLCTQFPQIPLYPTEQIPRTASVLINTLPQTADPEIYEGIGGAHVDFVFDLNYQSKKSSFFEVFDGSKRIFGLDMLLWQALYTWDIWLGPLENKRALKESLEKAIKSSHIVLTGFMGAGKSFLGKKLADALNLAFVDTDQEIERESSTTILELFKNKGEPAFRQIEREVVLKALKQERQVISLGGGAIFDPEIQKNLEMLGKTYFLHTPFETLYERIKGSQRPHVLQKTKQELFALYEQRFSRYQQIGATLDLSCKPWQIALQEIVDAQT
jgi:shikimate dehydrogenase